jgi:hypothetical protein
MNHMKHGKDDHDRPNRFFMAKAQGRKANQSARGRKFEVASVLMTSLLCTSGAFASAITSVPPIDVPAKLAIAGMAGLIGGVVSFSLMNEIPKNDE